MFSGALVTHSRRSTISTPLNTLLKSTSSSSPSSSLTVVTHCVLVILFQYVMRGSGWEMIAWTGRQAGWQAMCSRISLRLYDG